jgi:hypothetical protein
LGGMMIDDVRKTAALIEAMRDAVPFAVDLMPQLVAMLKARSNNFDEMAEHSVSEVSYAGDAGGIMCRIASKDAVSVVVVSLTHLAVHKSLPFANAVAIYQKHRAKKLKKQR